MASQSPTEGIAVSFGNTLQAKDDWYSFTESVESTVQELSVLANDLGGNALTGAADVGPLSIVTAGSSITELKTVGVTLQNDDGSFQPSDAYDSGHAQVTHAVALGDLDEDGALDIVAVGLSHPSASISVLLGVGDGTFESPTTYDSGTAWYDYQLGYAVALRDLNGDGALDAVIGGGAGHSGNASVGRDSLSVLLGNGDGTFDPATTYSNGSSGYFLNIFEHTLAFALGELDGNGSVDIVSGALSNGNDSIGVLLGNGEGTFSAATTYSNSGIGGSSSDIFYGGGEETASIALGDVNNDGNLDILAAARDDKQHGGRPVHSLGLLLGNGDGTFQAATGLSNGNTLSDLYQWESTTDVELADLDNDGNIDIIGATAIDSSAGSIGTGSVFIKRGNGDGTFQDAIFLSNNDGPFVGYESTSNVAVGDIDADGNLDIAALSGSFVGLLHGNGDGSFKVPVIVPMGAYSYSTDIALVTLGVGSAPGTVSIAAQSAAKAEGNSGTTAFTFLVTTAGDATATRTVSWAVTGAVANAAIAVDFAGGVLPSSTLTFAPGETTKVLTVNVAGDTTVEPDEGFIVTLSSPSTGLALGTASASVTIQNDDTVTVTAYDDAYIVREGQSLTIAAPIGVLYNDQNASSASLLADTGHGAVQLTDAGSFNYAPASGFTGVDSFTYHVVPGSNGVDGKAVIYVVPVTVGSTTTLDLLALTAEEQIAATYVAFFGRAADAPGFEFWVDKFVAGMPVQGPTTLFASIAISFGISDEARALYPFLVSPFGATDTQISAFLDSVYNNMFNRSSDDGGVAYWTGQIKATLQAGQFVGSVLVNIMSGAQDTAAGKDITTLMGKVAVSLDYVQEQQEHGTVWAGAADIAAATALLDPVGFDQLSVLVGMRNAETLIAEYA